MKIFKQHPKIWRRVASATLCMTLFGTNAFGALATDLDTDIPMIETTSAEEVWNSPELESDSSEPLMGQESDEELNSGRNIEPEKADGSNDPVTDENENLSTETVDGLDSIEEFNPNVDQSTLGQGSNEEDESSKEQSTEDSIEILESENEYTLHLTHYFRFTVDEKKRSVYESEQITLTDADFEDGICDLEQFSYDEEQLSVSKADQITLDSFDENGEAGGQIIYAVSDGWRMVRKEEAPNSATSLRNVFQGKLDNYEFVPADVITVKANYKYSNTGGLAGIDAASPETIEALPEDSGSSEEKRYTIQWNLPVVEGFRIVLDPSSLNKYVKNPPRGGETEEDLKAALESGDFDVDIDKHTIYYYQEKGLDSDNGDKHPTYDNIYSTEYNEAWNSARSLEGKDAEDNTTYTAQVTGSNANQGANPIENPKLVMTLTERQLNSVLKGETSLDITVYYRRNATWYWVKHWIPESLLSPEQKETIKDENTDADLVKEIGDVTYYCLDQDRMQGRVGAMTRAAARMDGSYAYFEPVSFSQKMIENTNTVVDIYYQAANSYRIIFDTNYTYIPRQSVPLGQSVDFSKIEKEPQRTGYTFAGWRYLKKEAQPDANGEYSDAQYIEVNKEGDSYSLTITQELLNKAKLVESGDVAALHLIPKWIPAQTTVRVVFWTENLTGTDDVQAVAKDGTTTYYDGKYTNFKNEPVTHKYNDSTGSSYSNAGSFVYTTTTDAFLFDSSDSTVLTELQTEINKNFKDTMGKVNGIDTADFYTQDAVVAFHEGSGASQEVKTASGDGKTTVYVYYTRNIYTLKFHYFGTGVRTVGSNNGNIDECVALNTKGYSYDNVSIANGELNFQYIGPNGAASNDQNFWQQPIGTGAVKASTVVPQTITIKAKYGADLNGVWPVARTDEVVYGRKTNAALNSNNEVRKAQLISWSTTAGKYRDDALPGSGSSHEKEPTIMGIYGAMGSEIIADPKNPNTTHHLVAYWNDGKNISYYRYNHCLEVPDLEINDQSLDSSSIQKIAIHIADNTNDNDKDRRADANYLYLIPVNNAAFSKYGFTDLMTVSYNSSTGTITYEDPNGQYYAVRKYTKNGQTKCYAISKRVDIVSRAKIARLNPSARLHLIRANDIADHSTQYHDNDGSCWVSTTTTDDYEKPIGDKDNLYDLYFYYNRDQYTINYVAPSNNESTGTSEVPLGSITLPYGAKVSKAQYGFRLDYQDKNNDHKYPWTPASSTVNVCPDRSETGTKEWTFNGWGLGAAGVNMLWSYPDSENDEFVLEGNLRLYAIWNQPTYTVKFYMNGGNIAGEEGPLSVDVPANTRYSANGTIPRPLRAGYSLDGWYEADEDGKVKNPEAAFNFDQVVSEDKYVVAKWTQTSTKTFDYTVYYLAQTLRDEDKDLYKNIVYIGDDGQLTENLDDSSKGKPYYILKSDENVKGGIFIPNASINLSAAKIDGYVPQSTNHILTMNKSDEDLELIHYDVMFYYEPVIPGSHIVQFVEAGTENSDEQNIVHTYQVAADQTVVTPQKDQITELTNKGYQLVNKITDTDIDSSTVTYEPAKNATNLTWIDENGEPKPITTLIGDSIPDVITYLVQPIPYTITYVNADEYKGNSLLNNALTSITSLEQTPVENTESGKNPTLYTTKDTFVIHNPAPVYDQSNGKWYLFSHWSLGTDTSVKPEEGNTEDKFNPLAIAAGTVGNLTFVANWKDATGTLSISKTVNGSFGDRNQEFEFSLQLANTGSQNTIPYTLITKSSDSEESTTEESKLDLDKNGSATFKLKHNQTITMNLPEGATFEVIEEAANQGGYETTINATNTPSDNSNNLTTDMPTGKASGSIIANQNIDVAYTNTKNAQPVTGIDGQNPAWILGLGVGTSLLALLFWMKKYKYEKE